MAELTVRNILIAGLVKAALGAAATTDTFDNDGKTIAEIANGSGGTCTVTVTGQVSLQHGVAATQTVAIPDGETWLVGPFPERYFNTDGANEVSITYSTVSSVTVAIFSVKDVHA